jgi:hypothetical protein
MKTWTYATIIDHANDPYEALWLAIEATRLEGNLCAECGKELTRHKRGPMRLYCTNACKQRAYRERQLAA